MLTWSVCGIFSWLAPAKEVGVRFWLKTFCAWLLAPVLLFVYIMIAAAYADPISSIGREAPPTMAL